MNLHPQNILVWLPSPLGDAILCTAALKAIRKKFPDASITFVSSDTVRDALCPCDLCNAWIPNSPSKELKKKLKGFDTAILFKNSFGSALTVFLAGIDRRIGYSREFRGFLLTEKIFPDKQGFRDYKPGPMIDYYLDLCRQIGCDTSDRTMHLPVAPADTEYVERVFSDYVNTDKPLVILVPGGAFGPSKLWPSERFALVADKLGEKYEAKIIVSVAPNPKETAIAKQICRKTTCKPLNLGDYKLTLGQLKALFAKASLVITNDTGPRHIAIALKRKVITLFGPNNPQWTQTGYEDEIQILPDAGCAPCDQPICDMKEHLCMNSIEVDTVFDTACKMLDR